MSIDSQVHQATHEPDRGTPVAAVVGAWLVAATPLAYGLWQTLVKAAKLFTG